jgi:histidine ammonia-lyase
MTAALKLRRVLENTRNVLAIEAMAAAQALDLIAPLSTSRRGQKACAAIRVVSPKLEKDRAMYQDFAKIADVIASGKFREVLE